MRKKNTKTSLQETKPKGMGLVEIVVAIGISVVTLTSSVVFSTRLAMRAQLTFVEESMLQLQSVVSEQLRLVEQGLKQDVKNNKTQATGGYLPAAASAPQMTWTQFCTNSTNNNYFYMNLPSFSSPYSNHTVNLFLSNGTAAYPPEDSTSMYIFTPVASNSKFGAFKDLDVKIGLTKSVDPSPLGVGNNITVRSVIKYNLYKKDYYTKPQEIKMIYNLVCA